MADRCGHAAPGFVALLAAFLLSACAETNLAIHAAKRIVPGSSDSVTPSQGIYKIGNPYQVGGVWYYPTVDYAYAETGIASWYGADFHGKRTANGETYDMNTLTAAHKTLPLPSVVRVVNLKNGRAVKLRVNDRGPFVNGRIIDVSRRAAQLLGFEGVGTAPVRVEVVADESRQVALLAQGGRPAPLAAVPTGRVTVEPLSGTPAPAPSRPQAQQLAAATPPPPRREEPEVTWVPVKQGTVMYVQAGAFVQRDYAIRLQRRLDALAPARVVEAVVGARRFWRVRLGPVASVEEGDRLLERVLAAGQAGARLVVE